MHTEISRFTTWLMELPSCLAAYEALAELLILVTFPHHRRTFVCSFQEMGKLTRRLGCRGHAAASSTRPRRGP